MSLTVKRCPFIFNSILLYSLGVQPVQPEKAMRVLKESYFAPFGTVGTIHIYSQMYVHLIFYSCCWYNTCKYRSPLILCKEICKEIFKIIINKSTHSITKI